MSAWQQCHGNGSPGGHLDCWQKGGCCASKPEAAEVVKTYAERFMAKDDLASLRTQPATELAAREEAERTARELDIDYRNARAGRAAEIEHAADLERQLAVVTEKVKERGPCANCGKDFLDWDHDPLSSVCPGYSYVATMRDGVHLSVLLKRAEAKLAEVTRERDVAREACEVWRAGILSASARAEKAEIALADVRADLLRTEESSAAWMAKVGTLEAALASSVRREDVVQWLRLKASGYRVRADEHRRAGDFSGAQYRSDACAVTEGLANDVDGGSWLRDLTTMDARPTCDCGEECSGRCAAATMDARPAEAKRSPPWCTCPESKQGTADQEWAHKKASCLDEDLIVKDAPRPANKETDNG